MTLERLTALAGALLAAAVLGGCAASSGTSSTTGSGSTPAATAMTPGMTMANGQVMGAMGGDANMTSAATAHRAARAAEAASQETPSPAAAMICSAEVRGDLREALGIRDIPAGKPTWNHGLFACSYALQFGTLHLSVKDLSSAAATTAYFAGVRSSLSSAHPIAGLTVGALGDDRGVVVLRKDDHVLTVDATDLPARFGTQGERRFDFAYEIAADILGCWTGD